MNTTKSSKGHNRKSRCICNGFFVGFFRSNATGTKKKKTDPKHRKVSEIRTSNYNLTFCSRNEEQVPLLLVPV